MGRGLSALVLITMTLLLGGCPPVPDAVVCDEAGCISERAFATEIEGRLRRNVVGYVVMVGSQPPLWGGQARTATDPPIPACSLDLRRRGRA